MPNRRFLTLDANEAVASVAHRLSEVIAIYPITPSSPMGEFADEWSAAGRRNLWGAVPQVTEMQSRSGRCGRRPWGAPGRRPRDDVHGVSGPAPHDSEHVQDRGRAHALRDARRRPHARHSRAFDLRRPLRRDGLPPDRFRDARGLVGPGGAGPRGRRPRRHARERASHFFISSTASGRRTRSRRSRRSPTTICERSSTNASFRRIAPALSRRTGPC